MIKFRLSTLIIALLSFLSSASAAPHVLRSVAYEDVHDLLVAQINLSENLEFIQITQKNQSCPTLASWKEGDVILVSSSFSDKSMDKASHQVTLVNETKNQKVLASVTENTLKELPQINSIAFEFIPHLLILHKEKACIGLTNGLFYEITDGDHIAAAKFWEKGDHIIVSDLSCPPDHKGPKTSVLINLSRPSAYKNIPEEFFEGHDLRKIIAHEL